jgi:hypothetical protein
MTEAQYAALVCVPESVIVAPELGFTTSADLIAAVMVSSAVNAPVIVSAFVALITPQPTSPVFVTFPALVRLGVADVPLPLFETELSIGVEVFAPAKSPYAF